MTTTETHEHATLREAAELLSARQIEHALNVLRAKLELSPVEIEIRSALSEVYATRNGVGGDRTPRTMGSNSAVAVGRFNPGGVAGYRAATAPGAALRLTRAAAVEDERAYLDSLDGRLCGVVREGVGV